MRFALELQALLDKVKGKLRNTYSESDFDSSEDEDDDVEQWMKDVESFLEEEQEGHNLFMCIVIQVMLMAILNFNVFDAGTCWEIDYPFYTFLFDFGKKG